ncbi:MAG: diguanylate cyclase [Deltaproteobacteria bacterium]|nr:diguanylate cyclase [Deltaproteobacteria bacterium]
MSSSDTAAGMPLLPRPIALSLAVADRCGEVVERYRCLLQAIEDTVRYLALAHLARYLELRKQHVERDLERELRCLQRPRFADWVNALWRLDLCLGKRQGEPLFGEPLNAVKTAARMAAVLKACGQRVERQASVIDFFDKTVTVRERAGRQALGDDRAAELLDLLRPALEEALGAIGGLATRRPVWVRRLKELSRGSFQIEILPLLGTGLRAPEWQAFQAPQAPQAGSVYLWGAAEPMLLSPVMLCRPGPIGAERLFLLDSAAQRGPVWRAGQDTLVDPLAAKSLIARAGFFFSGLRRTEPSAARAAYRLAASQAVSGNAIPDETRDVLDCLRGGLGLDEEAIIAVHRELDVPLQQPPPERPAWAQRAYAEAARRALADGSLCQRDFEILETLRRELGLAAGWARAAREELGAPPSPHQPPGTWAVYRRAVEHIAARGQAGEAEFDLLEALQAGLGLSNLEVQALQEQCGLPARPREEEDEQFTHEDPAEPQPPEAQQPEAQPSATQGSAPGQPQRPDAGPPPLPGRGPGERKPDLSKHLDYADTVHIFTPSADSPPPPGERTGTVPAGAVFDEQAFIGWRRDFVAEFRRRFRKAADLGRPFSLVLIGIDGFAAVHQVEGTERVRSVAERIASYVESKKKPDDLMALFGADRIAVALDSATRLDAHGWAQRLRIGIERLGLRRQDGAPITVSAGVAALQEGHHRSSHTMMGEAKKLLQAALRRGGGRVEI